MVEKIDPKMMKDLSKRDVRFVIRTGRELLFCCTTVPKFAITMELRFKSEAHAVAVEDWYMKKFSKKKSGRVSR